MRDGGEESKVLKNKTPPKKKYHLLGLKYKEGGGLPTHPPTDLPGNTTHWVVHFGGVWESLGF